MSARPAPTNHEWDALRLYGARAREVRTLRTGHCVPGPWQRIVRVLGRHMVLEDGTAWPLPVGADASGVYPPGSPIHLEVDR